MGRNQFFQFKQFRVEQGRAAMKVGIDGVLLGAWAAFGHEKFVLDIGCGTGLLALMAAQRSTAFVDAVEIEPEAALDADANFAASPWSSRLQLYRTDFKGFETQKRYQHIISNPPFFDETPRSSDPKRNKARHSESLSLNELIERSVDLLHPDGKISLILPAGKEKHLRSLARTNLLYPNRYASVFPDINKPAHRILAELSFQPKTEITEAIYIRNADSGEYTEQYKQITRDFYLAF
ncbi:MAG: tRNA1(Val) (adenine(37)-N6)-methyltransferase [Mangrovibacterium sp.]